MDRPRRRHRRHGRRHARRARLTDFVAVLERLPPAPLYALITALAAVENIFPPVPADVAVSLGAFLSGRGVMNPWILFAVTWAANVASGAAVYALGRRHGVAAFRGMLGQRLFSDTTVAHIREQYVRHGAWGIYISRLLPIWRGVVMPFAGIAGVSPGRALGPLALASATYYGALIALVTSLGTNFDDVRRVLGRINAALAIVAGALVLVLVLWIVRRLRS